MYRVLTFLILSLFALIHLIATQVVALDTDGLVGAWLFDEGKGEAVTDSSDNGLDGKITKGKPKWVDGKFEGAMEFGGADMVTVDDDNALDLEEFTIAAWVNIPKISGAWQIIASKEHRNPTGRNYGLFGNINTGVVHYSFTTNAGWKSFDAKTAVTDGIGITLRGLTMAQTSSSTLMEVLMHKSHQGRNRITTIIFFLLVAATSVTTG